MQKIVMTVMDNSSTWAYDPKPEGANFIQGLNNCLQRVSKARWFCLLVWWKSACIVLLFVLCICLQNILTYLHLFALIHRASIGALARACLGHSEARNQRSSAWPKETMDMVEVSTAGRWLSNILILTPISGSCPFWLIFFKGVEPTN